MTSGVWKQQRAIISIAAGLPALPLNENKDDEEAQESTPSEETYVATVWLAE